MTAKEKADELVNKFFNYVDGSVSSFIINEYEKVNGEGKKTLREASKFGRMMKAKECASIAVDEIIELLEGMSLSESGTLNMDFGQSFYKEVKEEINNL